MSVLLTTDVGQLEVLAATATDVVLARERDVTTDSAHQTTSAQLTSKTCRQQTIQYIRHLVNVGHTLRRSQMNPFTADHVEAFFTLCHTGLKK